MRQINIFSLHQSYWITNDNDNPHTNQSFYLTIQFVKLFFVIQFV